MAAICRATSGRKAPTICRLTPAGLHSGPMMLKKVRTPSVLRTGITWRSAGWKSGAKAKPMPVFATQNSTPAAGRSTFTPRASSTSAEPLFDDTDRLPCLTTGTPAPVHTSAAAVEMLNVPLKSPPVPHRSMASSASTAMGTAKARIVSQKATSSSCVSPRAARPTRKPAISSGRASPCMMMRSACVASSFVSVSPAASVVRYCFTPLRGAAARPGARCFSASWRSSSALRSSARFRGETGCLRWAACGGAIP